MKNADLIRELQKLPQGAEIYLRTSNGPGRTAIAKIEMALPQTIAMDKPGITWSEAVSDAIAGIIVAVPEAKA